MIDTADLVSTCATYADAPMQTIALTCDVTIDTGTTIPGPAIGTNTTGQEAEGPHCTSGGEH